MVRPDQCLITDDRIAHMLELRPRRMKLAAEWPHPLHPPKWSGRDWSLVLPFSQTFRNAFQLMCPVPHIGLREGRGGRCYTFLNGTAGSGVPPRAVEDWLSAVGHYVALRDCLALSFALDYDRVDGNPGMDQTIVGRLRTQAKPYDRVPTPQTLEAARSLAACLHDFARKVSPYADADCVVAIPPSDPAKRFDLPTMLAELLAGALNKPNFTSSVCTIGRRASIKSTGLNEKINTIKDTISVRDHSVDGKTVILVDDLYQSGVSMNYTAQMLQRAGASAILGIACEKTCRNDDNFGGRR